MAQIAFVRAAALGLGILFPLLASAANQKELQEKLHQAIGNNDVSAVKEVLRQGANPNGTSDYPFYHTTPLADACYQPGFAIHEALLDAGAKVNGFHSEDSLKKTAILVCLERWNREATKYLLSRGADVVHPRSNRRDSALHLAASQGNAEFIKLFVEKGAQINALNDDYETPLLTLLRVGSSYTRPDNYIAAGRELIRLKPDVNIKSKPDDVNAFFLASAARPFQSNLAIDLLNAGTRELDLRGRGSCDTKDRKCTPLLFALRDGNAMLVDALLEKGVNFDLKNPEILANLHSSSHFEASPEVFRVLVKRRVIGHDYRIHADFMNPERSEKSRTLLYWAAYKGHMDFVKELIALGADLSLGNLSHPSPDKIRVEESPLRVATDRHHLEVIRALLAADPERKANQWYPESFSRADYLGYQDTVSLFLESGVNPNQPGPGQAGVTEPSSCIILGAVEKNNQEMVKLLLKGKADPNLNCLSHWSGTNYPLEKAVFKSDRQMVDLLLEFGAKPQIAKKSVALAARYLDLDYVRKLTDAGGDINHEADGSRSALYYAAEKGSVEITRYLLSLGAKLEPEDPNLPSALHRAVEKNHPEIFELLFTAGAFHNPDPRGYDSAFFLALKNQNEKIALKILDRGVKDSLDDGPYLRFAARMGSVPLVHGLLKLGATPKISGALHEASSHGHLEVVRILLDAGDDSNKQYDFYNHGDWWRSSWPRPLNLASSQGHKEIVQLLLQRKASLNSYPYPIFDAAKAGHAETLKILIDGGADPKMKDGWSERHALSLASNKGHVEAVRVLLDAGVDVNFTAEWDNTALHFASARCHLATFRLLLERGANAQAESKDYPRDSLMSLSDSSENWKLTPLHLGVQCKDVAFVRELLEKGANLNAQLSDGSTPLYSLANKIWYESDIDSEIAKVRLLGERGADFSLTGPKLETPLAQLRTRRHDRLQDLIDEMIRWGARD